MPEYQDACASVNLSVSAETPEAGLRVTLLNALVNSFIATREWLAGITTVHEHSFPLYVIIVFGSRYG